MPLAIFDGHVWVLRSLYESSLSMQSLEFNLPVWPFYLFWSGNKWFKAKAKQPDAYSSTQLLFQACLHLWVEWISEYQTEPWLEKISQFCMRSVSIYYEMGPCKILFLDHKGTFGFNNQLVVCVFGINATITMDDGHKKQPWGCSQINWANFQIFFIKTPFNYESNWVNFAGGLPNFSLVW